MPSREDGQRHNNGLFPPLYPQNRITEYLKNLSALSVCRFSFPSGMLIFSIASQHASYGEISGGLIPKIAIEDKRRVKEEKRGKSS